MWTYCAATWFLVVADSISYLGTPAPHGPAWSGLNVNFIAPGQMIGASLLLLGSIFFICWAR